MIIDSLGIPNHGSWNSKHLWTEGAEFGTKSNPLTRGIHQCVDNIAFLCYIDAVIYLMVTIVNIYHSNVKNNILIHDFIVKHYAIHDNLLYDVIFIVEQLI